MTNQETKIREQMAIAVERAVQAGRKAKKSFRDCDIARYYKAQDNWWKRLEDLEIKLSELENPARKTRKCKQ
jgi:hypothetical protein